MNKKLVLENYLLMLKSTVEVYVHGTLESSNKDVRKLLKIGLDETLEHQEKVYEEMLSNNFYQVEKINENIINKTLNKINKNE